MLACAVVTALMLAVITLLPPDPLLLALGGGIAATLTLGPVFYVLVVRKLVRQKDALAAAHDEMRAIAVRTEIEVAQRTQEIEGTKRELEESLQRFTDIAETAADWIWEMDENLRLSFISSRFFEVFPIAREEVLGKTRVEFAGQKQLSQSWRRHLDDLENRRVFRDFSYETAKSDDRPKHISISGKPVFDANGNFRGYRGTGTDKTAQVESRKALEASEVQFRNLVEGSIQGVLVQSGWKILFANQALADILGYDSPDDVEALGTVDRLFSPREHKRLLAYRDARLAQTDVPEVYEARGRNRHGEQVWLELRVRTVDWQGIPAIQGVVIDINERKKAERLLQRQNAKLRRRDKELKEQIERFNAALTNMSQGLCMFDAQKRLVVSNDRYASIYGLDKAAVEPGMTLDDILAQRISNGILAGSSVQDYLSDCTAIAKAGETRLEIHELSNGHVIAVRSQPLSDGGWLETHEDITEYQQIERRLAHLAHHDALTDLANRSLLLQRIEEALSLRQADHELALLYLDLDGFKGINDTLGHSAGDQLLKIAGERLRNCVGKRDLVARLGGDEFAILRSGDDEPKRATELAQRICNAFDAPIDLGHNEVVVGVSIGIAFGPGDGAEPDRLIKSADLALYHAKSVSRGTFQVFKPELEASLKHRHAIGLDLRNALVREEFELYFQPLINLKRNRITGFEALIRWHHPEKGLVSPAQFIPIAEETGMICDIGCWVLESACAQALHWPEDITVAINVSPVQFKRPNLVEMIEKVLETSRLRPNRLELEITESVLLQDDGTTLQLLHRLKQLGVRISLDDFGTGYSSLSYLRSFPFDKIKIDASFVRDLSAKDQDIGIVQAVVGLASRLGVSTTAEGVETEEQLQIVTQQGCTEAQGYLFAPPLPAKDLTKLLPKQKIVRQGVA